MSKEFRDKEKLKQGIEKYKTVANLSKATGWPKTCIRRYLKRYELEYLIEHLPIKQTILEEYNDYRNREKLKLAILENKTVLNVHRNTGWPLTCIRRYLKKYDLECLIKHPAQNRLYSFNDNFFEHIDNENKAYWLGMLIADGNISDFGRKSYTIRLLLKESDIYHIESFCKDIDLNKKVHIDKDNRGSITIHSKKMYMDLINLGITPKKTRHEYFPEIPEHLIHHFIRGFFDGDGTIYSRNQTDNRKRALCAIGFVCGNNIFMETLINILHEKCNVHTSIHYKKDKDVYEYKTEAINGCKKIIEYMYKDATIFLKRKYERAMNFLKILPESGRKPRL